MTSLVLGGTALLAGASLVCGATAARDFAAPAHARRSGWLWLVLAMTMALAAVSRFYGLEGRIGDEFRAIAHADQVYDMRRPAQAIVTSLLVVVLAGLAAAGFLARRWPVATRIAVVATLAYVILVAARIVSLHAIDALLYYGPFHLNWLIELGLVVLIAGGAAATWLGSAPTRPRDRGRQR